MTGGGKARRRATQPRLVNKEGDWKKVGERCGQEEEEERECGEEVWAEIGVEFERDCEKGDG